MASSDPKTHQPPGDKTFDRLYIFFCLLLTAGAYVDAWAHNHLRIASENFFTPWHAMLYTSLFLVVTLFVRQIFVNRKRGFPWREILPCEYMASLYGIGVFLVAGASDMVWHLLFGIETDIDVYLSPTHLLLILGGIMIVSAPLRRIWYRQPNQTPWSSVASLSFVFLLLSHITGYLQPYKNPFMSSLFQNFGTIGKIAGGAQTIFFSALCVGLILSIIRQFAFPPGSLTLLFVLHAIGMAVVQDHYIFIATGLIAGSAIDLLYQMLERNIKRTNALRIFGFFAPILFFAAYTATTLVAYGTWWSIHMITGTLLLAGGTGYLMTFLVVLPSGAELPSKL